MRALLAAIGFLTRIPVPPQVFEDAQAQVHALPWYPLVGAILGALLLFAQSLLASAPPWLAAALLLVVWVALTGALHLDGLADSADAWVGGLGDRERTLQIMKDPRSGPMAVVAVTLLLLLKCAALASLPRDGAVVLLLAPMLARAALVAAFLYVPYVRAGGLGSALRNAPRGTSQLAVLLTAGLSLLAGWRGLCCVLVTGLMFVLWRRAGLRRLGGMSGDTCGALAECVEAGVLVAWLLSGT